MDDEEEHQRALEEQWMSGMTGLDEAAAGGGSSGEGQSSLSLSFSQPSMRRRASCF